MQENSEIESFTQIIDPEQLKEISKEKKTLKKTKLDLEVLRKKSRRFRKFATKTKNMLLESISKFASRISLKKAKSNVIDEINENPKENEKYLISKEDEDKKEKVETISISLNIVEYAPKIFDRLRKIDGVTFKELLE